MRPFLHIAVALIGSGCGCGVLRGDSRAASVPQTADVAIGATHDLLVIACQDRVTLTDFVFPVAATALFVGVGRLDAAFYLPDALAKAAIPRCDTVDYTVSGVELDGPAFELETTMNPRAFKLHAKSEGESTFSAQAAVGNEVFDVSSTLHAWTADRVEFSVQCDNPQQGMPDAGVRLPGWVPAGATVATVHRLFHGDTRLTGYGLLGVSHPRMTLTESRGGVTARFGTERGPFTVTSPIDPSFMLELTTYDASDYDPPTLERTSNEHLFPGETTSVLPRATIQGRLPCVAGVRRSVTVSPPSVCRFSNVNPVGGTMETGGNGPIPIEAVGPGTCRVRVTTPDARSASLDIPVYRGFEVLAELPDAGKSAALTDMMLFTTSELHLTGFRGVGNSPTAESAALRLAGGTFAPLRTFRPPTELHAVHGTDPTTVFAVGTGGFGARYDGMTWTPFDAGTGTRLNAVWVNSATDVYTAGNDGGFTHFDGTTWTTIDAGTTAWLAALWSDGAGVLYVTGDKTLLTYDGGVFTNVLAPALSDGGYFFGTTLAGTAADDLWLIAQTANFDGQDLFHFDGTAWTRHDLDAGFLEGARAVVPMPGGFVYALVHRDSRRWAERFDGSRWVRIPLPAGSRAMAASGNDVIVFTGSHLVRYRHDPADVFP